MPTLKLQRLSAGMGVVFPEEALAQLGLQEGDAFLVVSTREGLLLSPFDAEVAEEVRLGRVYGAVSERVRRVGEVVGGIPLLVREQAGGQDLRVTLSSRNQVVVPKDELGLRLVVRGDCLVLMRDPRAL